MVLFSILLWVGLSILFYTYAGYAILLYLYNNVRKIFTRRYEAEDSFQPDVTLIVPAYNEAEILEAKIQNCLDLEYPHEKLVIIFITDGTTDDSKNILYRYNRISHLHEPERLGKMTAINRAMQHVQTPVVIFSDANTILNTDAVSLIVKHYSDSKIGGVAGEKKVEINGNDETLLGEGIYWQYESKMKQLDSDFNTVVGAAGELFSMRTELFTPQKEDTLLDDFILSLNICLKGYKVIYEPLAYAIETPSINLREESKRRIRIAAGAFQSLVRLPQLFNVFRFPLLSFQYISRRVFRWALSPLALIVVYVSNLALIFIDENVFYKLLFIIQNIAYLLALAGYFIKRSRVSIIIFIPFYFVFMNTSLIIGLFRYISGKQSVIWQKAERSAQNNSYS